MRYFSLRPHHFFISYSHKDATFAHDIKNWLSATAGLRIWFDELDLRSGDPVEEHIASTFSQCQGIIFLLSNNSLESPYVRDELNQALAEKKGHSRFQIVLLRIDDCDVATTWKTVRHLKWHDLATPTGPQLGLQHAAEILCRTHAFDGWQHRQDELKEIYVSRGWRPGEEAFADDICRSLAGHGLRLVGDLENRDPTNPRRLEGIMRSCWGHALILPHRNSADGPDVTYKHFMQERDLSERLGVPRISFVPPECRLPDRLAEKVIVVPSETLGSKGDAGPDPLLEPIYEFVENLIRPQTEVHAFFASDYRGNEERNRLARAVVEATGTLPCHWGRNYRDMNIQGCIRDAIVSAKFVVADLTSVERMPDSAAESSRVNVNACIEAAIAWGASVPVLCLAAANPQSALSLNEGKTKHVPFMFRAAQLDLYGDKSTSLAPGVEFLGTVHKAVLEGRKKFGRRVVNYELGL